MAGSSFGKYERDRNKRAKAAAKRERRQNKPSAEESAETDLLERPPHADLSPEELLKRIEEIHRRFDEGQRVEFDIAPGRKGEEAQNVRVI